MKLDKWLVSTDTTASALAKRLSCSVSTITRIAKGETKPTWAMAWRIVDATKKKVSINDLYSRRP